jgi:hypothetical protein
MKFLPAVYQLPVIFFSEVIRSEPEGVERNSGDKNEI